VREIVQWAGRNQPTNTVGPQMLNKLRNWALSETDKAAIIILTPIIVAVVLLAILGAPR